MFGSGSNSDSESEGDEDSEGMEEKFAWEGKYLHLHDSDPLEPSEDVEDLIPSQEPTEALPPQRAMPNVEELTEIPGAKMVMDDVEATSGLETLMDPQEVPSTLRHGPGNASGEF